MSNAQDSTEAPSLPSMSTMSFEPAPPALQVKLLSSSAKTPTRGSPHAAGYDLYAAKEATVPRRGKVLVDLDISIAVPAGTYGRIAPRSGLASKHSIDTGAGVIDADYRGPVKVLLFNFSDEDFIVAVGERVAQLIVERVSSS
jgi:dUTP pyrophosphatase